MTFWTIFFLIFSGILFLVIMRSILFWLYLWQLKNYHIGRFIDHFRTEQGKKLLWNKSIAIKLFLAVSFVVLLLFVEEGSEKKGFLLFAVAFWILAFFSVYVAGAGIAFKRILKKQLLLPVPTSKIILLCFTLTICTAIFLFYVQFAAFLPVSPYLAWLGYDLLTPILVSVVVLVFQPFTVLRRSMIIERAREKRSQFKNLIVVGITGSYGKTSTKEFLAHILSQKFKVLKTKEHQNSEVGISQCILNELDGSYQVFVCEMGAYNRGGIRLLASIAKPTIGMLTGINEQHMATFGSQENIIKAKYELIESLPSNGVAFFNARNRFCAGLYNKATVRKVLYGQNARFPGEENILGAIAVAKELGMSQEEIARGTKGIADTFPGVQITTKKEGLTVIDATYSANPDGAIANLEYLETFPGKKILVMPCLIELGSAAKEVHERIGKKIAETCDLAIITTKDRFEDIKKGAGGSGKVIFVDDPIKIVGAIKNATKQGDVVLLEGRVPQGISESL